MYKELLKVSKQGTSLELQWLRLDTVPLQGTWVQFLFRELRYCNKTKCQQQKTRSSIEK